MHTIDERIEQNMASLEQLKRQKRSQEQQEKNKQRKRVNYRLFQVGKITLKYIPLFTDCSVEQVDMFFSLLNDDTEYINNLLKKCQIVKSSTLEI